VKDKLLGGLYGLLIGDAAGVPYEFKRSKDIPTYAPMWDLGVPIGYNRTYDHVPTGTWSDDGSQALCLLETLVENNGYNEKAFLDKLLAWKDRGYMTPDGKRFDIGNQTSLYLSSRQAGLELQYDRESTHCGNGSLMRTLPVALFFDVEETASEVAEQQSILTHPQYVGTISCVLYTHIALALLAGEEKTDAIEKAIEYVAKMYTGTAEAPSLKIVFDGERKELSGSGYVVDALWSALHAFVEGNSFEDVLRKAIAFGDDTDTTACIAGGLAGIYYGYSKINLSYIDALKGKTIVEDLANKLLVHRGL